MWSAAERHLAADPAMARLISRIGRCRLRPDRNLSPYEALVRAIAHQQLHARADGGHPRPLSSPLRRRLFPVTRSGTRDGAGLAPRMRLLRGEDNAILDICAHAQAGTVPTRHRAHRLTDDELIERMTAIRGVGRWTVEMLLIFTLGRPDVLPVDDFGVREGFRALHGLDKAPTPRALREAGARLGAVAKRRRLVPLACRRRRQARRTRSSGRRAGLNSRPWLTCRRPKTRAESYQSEIPKR